MLSVIITELARHETALSNFHVRQEEIILEADSTESVVKRVFDVYQIAQQERVQVNYPEIFGKPPIDRNNPKYHKPYFPSTLVATNNVARMYLPDTHQALIVPDAMKEPLANFYPRFSFHPFGNRVSESFSERLTNLWGTDVTAVQITQLNTSIVVHPTNA